MESDFYIFIYVSGCIAAFVVWLSKFVILKTIGWFTKVNVAYKNLKKLEPPDDTDFTTKFIWNTFIVLIEVVLSWVGAIINFIHLIVKLFQVLRESFTSVPEEIKQLRFPIRNNPNLSREAVWAHVVAINVKLGQDLHTHSSLNASLEDVSDYYQDFNKLEALNHLKTLKIIDNKIILSTANEYEHQL